MLESELPLLLAALLDRGAVDEFLNVWTYPEKK
jgi:hypothetical protein